MAVKEKAAATFTNTVTLESTLAVTGVSTFTGNIIANGNLNAYGTTVVSGKLISNYTDFNSGYTGALSETVVAVSDAEANAAAAGPDASTILAATFASGAQNTIAFDGNAAGSVYLPVCAANTYLSMTMTALQDETAALTIFARGAAGEADALFARQSIVPNRQGTGGAGLAGAQVATDGTVDSPTAIKLIYTATTANNICGIGTTFLFYAPIANEWLVKVLNQPQGTGATGAFTTSTS